MPGKRSVLKRCRCQDCPHWDDLGGCRGGQAYRPVRENNYLPMFRHLFNTFGMMDPTTTHHCAFYPGPTDETITYDAGSGAGSEAGSEGGSETRSEGGSETRSEGGSEIRSEIRAWC